MKVRNILKLLYWHNSISIIIQIHVYIKVQMLMCSVKQLIALRSVETMIVIETNN